MKKTINNIKKYLEKNKKQSILIGSISLLLLIAVVIILIVCLTTGKEKKLIKNIEDMGRDFYENLYYEQVGKNEEERAAFLKDFVDIGLKINLDGLSRYKTEENQEKINEFVNPKTKEACDKENSKVIIYPKEPFGKSDYQIEVNLECGFDKK